MMRILIIVCLFLTQCVYYTSDIAITPLDPYFKLDSFENSYGKVLQCSKYYLVEYFKNSDERGFNQLKNFAFSNLDSTFSNYNIYSIIFYRTSVQTDRRYKESPSDLIEWHGDDIIYTFEWNKGKYIGYYKYKNGKVESDSLVTREADKIQSK